MGCQLDQIGFHLGVRMRRIYGPEKASAACDALCLHQKPLLCEIASLALPLPSDCEM
tara:strand:+ start:1244 stop:1414 length:171 start_codon:yes stop_codon:yes gene_type:complete